MTSPAFIELPQKFNLPLVPVQIIRTKGANFKVIIHPPVKLQKTDGEPENVEKLIAIAHEMLENWIKQNPGQWIWLHRRWMN